MPRAGGDLLERIAALRRQVASELGLVVPRIHIHDNMQIDAHGYIIKVRSAKVATGKLYPGQLLAVGGQNVSGRMLGRPVEEPVYGESAVWISPAQKDRAVRMGYVVSEAASVLMAHLGEIVRRHACDMLTRQEVCRLLDSLKASAPDLAAGGGRQAPGGPGAEGAPEPAP